MADLFAMLQAAAGNAGEDVDPDFANTVLLLHGDGTNGAQNNTFLDSSTNNFTITRNGNTTQGTFTPFSKPDGRWGNYFDGVGDRLDIADNAAFVLTSTAFTIEAWVYMEANNGQYTNWIVGKRSTNGVTSYAVAYILGINASGYPHFWDYTVDVISSTTISLNTWNHIVVTHDGTNATLYLNGSVVAGPTAMTITDTAATVTIGDYTVGTSPAFKGYISGVKIVKGYANAPSGIPTTPATNTTGTSLLTCQSNRFVDNSTNNFAITRNGDVKVTPFSPFPITTEYSPAVNGGSAYFDNTGDYLTAAGNAAFDMSTGDFTWEGWAYIPSDNAGSAVFAINGAELFFRSTANGQKVAFYNGSVIAESDTAYSFNQWNHVAVTRSGTTLRVYLNGVSGPSATHSSSVGGSASTLYIGSWTDGSSDSMFGWLFSVRIVKGTAVYTGASFTPPTAPLTAIANTSLLCNFTNAGIFDNTGFNNLETVADAQIDTSVKKYGTGSMEFDGTGDYLVTPNSENFNLSSGSWTIELWAYITGGSGYRTLVAKRASTNAEWELGVDPSGYFYFYTSVVFADTTVIPTNQWVHLAATYDGSNLRLFQDGVVTKTQASVTAASGTSAVNIATSFSGGQPYTGLIDDLRITKGVARYTAAFTPPDKAFPNVGA